MVFEKNLYVAIENWKKMHGKFIFPNHRCNVEGIGGGDGTVFTVPKSKFIVQEIKNQIYRMLFAIGYWPK